MMENLENKQTLDELLLKGVSGGTGSESGNFQLYYKGEPLDMTKTVAQLCVEYSELGIQAKLGIFYSFYAKKTLNEMCVLLGEATIQSLIDKNG